MELYPHNLGERLSQKFQQRRTFAYGGRSPLKPNALIGWMLGSLGLSVVLWSIQSYALAVIASGVTAWVFGWYAYLALRSLDTSESQDKPLSSTELHLLRQSEIDPLVQNYLTLTQTVLSLPATEDETAEREVREAIMALGIALEALPPEQKISTDNPGVLRAESEAQDAAAQAETDPVIAASLHRRAESLLRRADTAARTLLLLRRNQALREEVGEQINALQTSLTALQVGGRQSAPELADLAASIQRVAYEANALTTARAEV